MSASAKTIAASFSQAASQFADHPLVWDAQGPATFAEVDHAAQRVAAQLQASGVVPGDRVALYCINGLAFVQAYLAIQKVGAVLVPVNLLIGADEIAYILNDASAKALIYHAAMAEKLPAFRDQVSSVEIFCCIGAQGQQPGDALFADWLAAGQPFIEPQIVPTDTAAILYTSGTTGRPKGAMLSHHNLVSNAASVFAALHLRSGVDRLLVVLPMFHAFAATVGVLTPCLHGLTIVPVPKFDPALVSDVVAASQATVFLGVPSMYNLVLRLPEEQSAKWSSIRYGVAGGAAMPVELLKRFEERYQFPILEGDGPTECSPVTCVNPLQGERKAGSVGLPVPQVEMAIFNDAGAQLPVGDIGEICVRGPNVMQGYWQLSDETAAVMFGEWLRTGDLGYCDEDGYFFMVDRIKDLIIVNGMNVYPRMVEETLYEHPQVLEVAVVGEPHESHGEIVVAHVVMKEGADTDASALKGFCRERLGVHQVPRKILLRDSLPKNATGKILKRELRKEGELERGVDSR